jgi:outer membrane protein assembly factor BamB
MRLWPPSTVKSIRIALAILATATQSAQAEDWPRWRGPRQDGVSRETGLLTEWPTEGPKQLWTTPLIGGFSSVAVADGRLFTQTKEKNQEVVLCLDAATGKEFWRYRYDCDYAAHPTFTGGGMPKSRTGPRATPAVDAGRVYTVGSTGILLCLDAKTGDKLWQQDLLKIGERTCHSHGYCGSPLVVGNHVYVQPGGSNGKSLAALDKKSGDIVWTALDDPPGQATPLWEDRNGAAEVIFFTGTGAVGVAPQDGKLLWRYPWKTRFDLNIATPIYADGTVFISSNYGTGAARFRPKDGTEPETIWKSRSMQNHFTSSVLYQGCLYGFSEYRLRCVDFQTGKINWDKSGLGRGSLVVADGHMILLGDDGQLVLAKPNPTEYVEVSRCQVFEKGTLTWIVPVLSDGRLFVRSQYALLALDLRGTGNVK